MADTKVSGLAAAAAFAPATTQEFPINDAGTSHKVSAAQMAAYFPNGTQGSAWYAQVTANQGALVAQADITGLTVTVTIGTGRRVRVSVVGSIQSTVAGDYFGLYIMEGATQLAVYNIVCDAANANSSGTPTVILTPTAAAHTYKVQAGRNLGTGTGTFVAGVGQPAYIMVEDLGT